MRYRVKMLLGFAALGLLACGTEEDAATTSSEASSHTFAAQIEPIIKGSCGGVATCHASGESGTPIYEGAKSQFVADAEKILQRIDSTESALVMPKPGYSITLSAANKKIIKDYLSQKVRD